MAKQKSRDEWEDKDDYNPDDWRARWDKTNSTHFIINYGKWIPLSKKLIKFMGLTNAIFLTGLIDLHTSLRKKRKVKKGQLFYSAPKFKEQWGLSRYYQRQAIRQLSAAGLLKKVKGKTSRNQTILKINFYGYCLIVHLINEVKVDAYEDELASLFSYMTSKAPQHRPIRRLMRRAMNQKCKYREFLRRLEKLW